MVPTLDVRLRSREAQGERRARSTLDLVLEVSFSSYNNLYMVNYSRTRGNSSSTTWFLRQHVSILVDNIECYYLPANAVRHRPPFVKDV